MARAHAPAGPSAADANRAVWQRAQVVPLWESPTAHKPPRLPDRTHLWSWQDIADAIDSAIRTTDPKAVERRVLSLVRPESRDPADEATSGTLSAAIQILLPGESARPHRHSMNALRFMLSGEGAVTIVDGKRCPMHEGDLILTPAWCWHEHAHPGERPAVWLDILDVPLHLYLGTERFQPGPARDVPPMIDDDAFAVANMIADTEFGQTYSPVFRYPVGPTREALNRAPKAREGIRRVRYANPVSGGTPTALIDCWAELIAPSDTMIPYRTTASAVCAVISGAGRSRIGDQELTWGPHDIFSLPRGNWIEHHAADRDACLFVASEREVLRRLGLLEHELGGPGAP